MSTLSLYFWTAEHRASKTPIGFVVVAESQDRAGWPVLAKYEIDGYTPVSCQKIAEVPFEGATRVVEYFGPKEVEPPKKPSRLN